MKKMDRVIKYGLVILRNGRFLVNREYNTELFLMPGGRPKEGEGVEDCLIREVMEEHGVELVRESIKYFGDFEDWAANEPNTKICMSVYTGEINGEPRASSEVDEQRWFGKLDNPSILSPIIRNHILPALISRGYLGR